MADFSFLSDTDDSAVEDLLSQTQDLCVLEQLSAINCSGFTDSALPSDLESRFRKLKSFPAAKSETRSTFDSKIDAKSCHDFGKKELGLSPKSQSQRLPDFTPMMESQNRKRNNGSSRAKSKCKYVSTPSNSSSSSGEIDEARSVFDSNINRSLHSGDAKSCDVSAKEELGFSPKSQSQRLPKKNRKRNNGSSRAKSKCKYVSSPSNSSSDEIDEITVPKKKETKNSSKSQSNSESVSMASPPRSPPRKTGCFWCSPKKSSAKKNGGNRFLENDLGWAKNNDFLSDLGIFSTKEQQKNLRKAMKEEEKINREAEKIVKWAKQASARMNISDIEDELSDHEFKK